MHNSWKRIRSSLATALVFQLAGGLMAANFTDLMEPPNAVEVVLADHVVTLSAGKSGKWAGDGVEVMLRTNPAGVVLLKAPGVPVKKVHLHWAATFDTNAVFLGDAWERAYGDLEWKPVDKTGPMPWYFLV